MKSPQFIDIDAAYEGQRIDNFLMTRLKGVPRSHIYRILRRGEVRVNKSRIRPAYRLQSGDVIRIPPLSYEGTRAPPRPSPALGKLLQQAVLYEDAGLLIINKPAGMAVHGGSGLSYGVIEALRALRPWERHLELIHRLDRDTSGCLMVAKKRSQLRYFHELLRGGAMEKSYLALVSGRWQGGERVVEEALHKNRLQSGERMVRVSGEGKDAVTLFRPHTCYQGASLMWAQPVTGRTHQIRVHAAHIGHGIAGDEKYGDPDFNRSLRRVGLKRLFLHAHSLTFPLPGESGKTMTVTAPLEKELEQVLARLASEQD